MLYKEAASDVDQRGSPQRRSHESQCRSRGRAKVATSRRWWQNTAVCKYFARAVAAVLVSVGLAGLVGALHWHSLSGVYHVALGLLFAYGGFFVEDRETVRQMVGGLGVLVLVVKGLVIFIPSLWGEHPLWGPVEVSCLIVGIASVFAAKLLRDPTTPRG